LASKINFKFPNCKGTKLKHLITRASDKAIDLLESMLSFNPVKRPSAAECLRHPFFQNNDIIALFSHKILNKNSSISGVGLSSIKSNSLNNENNDNNTNITKTNNISNKNINNIINNSTSTTSLINRKHSTNNEQRNKTFNLLSSNSNSSNSITSIAKTYLRKNTQTQAQTQSDIVEPVNTFNKMSKDKGRASDNLLNNSKSMKFKIDTLLNFKN
jgi:serine/threonine protein kinase